MDYYESSWVRDRLGPEFFAMHTGDMQFDTDPEIVAAIHRTMARPLCYAEPPHEGPAGKSIRSFYSGQCGIEIDPRGLWFASGCLAQSTQILRSLVAPGDLVLTFTPAFSYLLRDSLIRGASIVEVNVDNQTIDSHVLDAAWVPGLVGIYLVNPHNPTGRAFSPSELQSISEFALGHGLWIVNNELHSRVSALARLPSFAQSEFSAGNRVITLGGASKSHNLAGLSGSFAFSTDVKWMEEVRAAAGLALSDASTLQQVALAVAYRQDSEWLKHVIAVIHRNRELLTTALETAGARVHPASATYFLWADFTTGSLQSNDAAASLQSRSQVVAMSGTAFGGSARQVRFSLAMPTDRFDEALARLASSLDT